MGHYLESQLPLEVIPVPRQKCILTPFNRMNSEDATAIVWNDRLICITPAWDFIIERHMARYPTRVMWWQDRSSKPTGSFQWIMPPRYLKAIDYQISADIFPFWFDDLWQFEIDWFVSQDKRLHLDIASAGIHKTTTRGREFRFWTEVFIATRPKRLAIAERACLRMDMEWKPPNAAMIAHYERNDRWQLNSAEYLEKTFGDASDPDPAYVEAKQNAEKLLTDSRSQYVHN